LFIEDSNLENKKVKAVEYINDLRNRNNCSIS